MTTDTVLDHNGDSLAHVVEQAVVEDHYVHGHGGPLHACEYALCAVWRRFLASRLP